MTRAAGEAAAIVPRTVLIGLAVIATVGAGLLAAPVAQGSYFGTADDPSGDSSDPSPGRDLTAAALSYDRRRGVLEGAVRMQAPPGQAPGYVTLFAGLRTATGCDGYPALGFGSASDAFSARWLRLDDPSGAGPRGDARKRGGDTAVQRFSITDPQLAGLRPNCVIATLGNPDDATAVYDAVGPIELVARPELTVELSRVPTFLVGGRTRQITVTVRNVGDAATGPVRVRYALARGVRTQPRARSLPSIAAGGRRTTKVAVTLSARGTGSARLKVRATAGPLEARDDAALNRRRATKPGTGGGGGGGGGSHLCTRYQADLSGQTGGSLILVPC